jgi:hypothetical protein
VLVLYPLLGITADAPMRPEISLPSVYANVAFISFLSCYFIVALHGFLGCLGDMDPRYVPPWWDYVCACDFYVIDCGSNLTPEFVEELFPWVHWSIVHRPSPFSSGFLIRPSNRL